MDRLEQIVTGGPGEALLSPREIARWLGVSRRTVRRLAEAGEFRPYRVGRQLRYSATDVRRWLDERQS